MQAMEISRTGLDIEWRRLELIAANLANVNTTRTAGGGAYEPQRLISGPAADFQALVGLGDAGALSGVMVYGVEPTGAPPRKRHDPEHPHADANGDVFYPGLDHAAEMILMVETARAYEANLVAMGAARQMYAKALELGRR